MNEPLTLTEWRDEAVSLRAQLQATKEKRDALASQVAKLEGEKDALEKDFVIACRRVKEESRLACDLRSTQDEIIERCAKAVDDFPEAAKRLRSHCGNDDKTAVSGEDFGEMRRENKSLASQVWALRKALTDVLSSASPHPEDNPSMFMAFKQARAVLDTAASGEGK